VTSTTGSSISLSWTEPSSSDPAASYKVYEGSTVVATPTNASATITGLAPNTGHTYTVTAIDSAGNQSAFSASVHTATTSPIGQITGFEGLCLDDSSASTASFNPVQVFTCNGTNAQQWTIASGNTLQVLGMCLDVDAAGTANGTLVDLFTCNGTGAQVWIPQSNGELVNPNSGKCLDDTGWGGSGTQVQIWACADTTNQQWTMP
jgi:chitodextrinase